jgi:hypothetical protein
MRKILSRFLMASVLIGLAAAIAAAGSQSESEQGTGGDIYITISPDLGRRIDANERIRAQALLRDAEGRVAAIKKIKLGPCMCGAPSHEECKTPDICEPIEQKIMDSLAARAARSQKEAIAAVSVAKDIQSSKGPGKALAKRRAEALQEEISNMEQLRDKLQSELRAVKSRSPDPMLLRHGSEGIIAAGFGVIDMAVEWLPEEKKETAKELKNAIEDWADALKTGESSKRAEAAGRTAILLRGELQRYVRRAMEEKKKIEPQKEEIEKHLRWEKDMANMQGSISALDISARIYDLGEEVIAASVEWDQKHDAEKLKERASRLIEKTSDVVGAIPNEYCRKGAAVFTTAYGLTSLSILGWHAAETYGAIKLNLEKNLDAQLSLQKQVLGLTSHIDFKKREKKKYENFATKN